MAPRSVEGVRVTGFEMDGGRITAVADHRRPHRLRDGRQLRRPMGARRSAPWPASTCRCSRSSTSTSSPKRSTAWRPTSPTHPRPRSPHLLQGRGRRPGDGRLRARPDRLDHRRRPARLRVPALRRRLGPFRAAPDAGDRPRAGARDRRRPPDDQRPGELHARRQFHPRRRARMRQHVSSAPASTPSASPRAAAPAGPWPNGRCAAKRRSTSGSSTSAASRPCTATATGCSERTLEAYGKHYTVAFPHEEYESGRNRIVSPLYDRLKAHGAVFGSQARLGAAELVRAARHRAARRLFDGPAELVRPGRRRAPPGARERSASSTSPPSPNTK